MEAQKNGPQGRPDDNPVDDAVWRQYEAYPYPARDPRDEAKRLHISRLSSLPDVNHYLFRGRRDFGAPFRALVAGGGTGDATVMMAQQLADRGGRGEVVHLDLSAASRRVAEARAEARGLTNIRFVTGSLLDLPELELGQFDYIDCCGVLHHLESPEAGLRALAGALAPGGGLGLMVYGALGRTGLYPLQAVLRRLARGRPLEQQIPLARRLIETLPATNWFRRNPFLVDHKQGDAGLVDLCLHSRDRAYRIGAFVDLLSAADLAPVAFIEPLRYEPETYLGDPVLIEKTRILSVVERASLAEILAGNLKTHIVYAAPQADAAKRVAQPDREDAVPLLSAVNSRALIQSMGSDFSVTPSVEGVTLRFVLPPLTSEIFAKVDGRATLGEIHRALRTAHPSLDWPAFKAQFDRLYKVLNGLNAMLIAYPKSRD